MPVLDRLQIGESLLRWSATPPEVVEPSKVMQLRRIVRTALEITEEIGTAVTYDIQLDGLTDPPTSSSVVVPILERSTINGSEVQVTVVAGGGQREIAPFSGPSLLNLAVSAEDAETYLWVELTSLEISLAPVVQVRLHNPPRSNTWSLAKASSFRPVLRLDVPLADDGETPPSVYLDIPEGIALDEVALACRTTMPWDEERAAHLDVAIRKKYYPLAVKSMKEAVDEWLTSLAAIQSQPDVEREASRTQLAQQLADLIDRLHQWIRDFVINGFAQQTPDEQGKQCVRAVEEFQKLQGIDEIGFRVFLERSASGELTPDPLLLRHARVHSMSLAYSESSSWGLRRPAFLLGLLGLVQAILAWRLSSALDLWPFNDWFSQAEANRTLGENRVPLVAMLLLFPALLYSEVTRIRPRETIRRRAQLRYAALITMGFFIPIGPALLSIGPPDAAIVSWALCFSAAAATVVAVLAWFWTSESSLRKARTKALGQ